MRNRPDFWEVMLALLFIGAAVGAGLHLLRNTVRITIEIGAPRAAVTPANAPANAAEIMRALPLPAWEPVRTAVSPSPRLPLGSPASPKPGEGGSLSSSFHAAASANGSQHPRVLAHSQPVVPAARGLSLSVVTEPNLRAAAHTGAGVQPRVRGPEQSFLPAGGRLLPSVCCLRRHGMRVPSTPKPAGRDGLLCALRGPRSVPSVAKIETHV